MCAKVLFFSDIYKRREKKVHFFSFLWLFHYFKERFSRRSRYSVDNSYLTFARTITRRARVRQLIVVFGSACRALHAAELRYLSASGRCMHRWCVLCAKSAFHMAKPRFMRRSRVIAKRAGSGSRSTRSTRSGGAAGYTTSGGALSHPLEYPNTIRGNGHRKIAFGSRSELLN